MKKNSTLLCFLIISSITFAQPTYTKSFGIKGSNSDYECAMIPLENGAVVALGNSIFGKHSNRWDIDFVKLDEKGNVLIQKRFSTDYSSGDVKSIQTSDGGFMLFVSEQELNDKTGKRLWGAALIKLNNKAEVEWAKYYNSVTYRCMTPYALIQSKSGDFIIHYGLSHDYLTDNEMGVMKISPTGSIIWDTTMLPTIPYYYEYYGTTLLETANGKILLGGYLQTEDPFQDYRSSIIQLNGDGKFEKALYIRSDFENPFALKKIYQINKELVLYGSDYTFTINMDTPEFITGTSMSFQYFLYRKYPALRPQQLYGTCYFKDGSIIQVFRGNAYQELGYDVVVKKYDSLFRICPDYIAKGVNEYIDADKFQLRKLTVYNVSDNYTVSDIHVYDSTLNFVQTTCTGDVPPFLKTNSLLKEKVSIISIYPNPTDNILHVLNLKEEEKYQLTILNNLGNVFKQFTVEKLSAYDFNLSGLKPGVYYLKVQSANTNTSYLFIKN